MYYGAVDAAEVLIAPLSHGKLIGQKSRKKPHNTFDDSEDAFLATIVIMS